MRIFAFCACAAGMLLSLPSSAGAQGQPATLDRGYRLMYSLEFDAADREFAEWQRLHPGDALAPVSRAANVLFREFDRLGVLQAQLFQDNAVFTSATKRAPDPMLARRLDAFLVEAETVANARLALAPEDRDALFAMTLVNGLRADDAALVEQRNMAALSYTRQATTWATKLLAIAPDYYDAYMATGMNAYLVGSLPLPLRWVLRIGGYQGDKSRGVRELKLVAERGRLLAPFARILLAVASLRDHDVPRARVLLAGLAREFPSNPLFERELRRLDGRSD